MAHKVHFSFWLYEGVWLYRFIGPGIALLGPMRRTRDPEKLRGIAERGNGFPNLEAKLMFEYAVKLGKGGLELKLTDEQYKALGGD